MRVSNISMLFIISVFLLYNSVSAQSTIVKELPIIYLHVGSGAAFSFYSSSDIDGLIYENFDIARLGAPFSYSFCLGIKNLLQVEYRRGDSAHDFRYNVAVGDKFVTKEEVK